TMVLLAVAIAVVAGVTGLNLSFLGNFPTGPFVVLALSVVFLSAYLFSPRYGVLIRTARRWRQARQTERENGLKSIYQAIAVDGSATGMTLARLADVRNEPESTTRRVGRTLVRYGWARQVGDMLILTERGQIRARELARNYRLWELFLTHEVNLPLD